MQPNTAVADPLSATPTMPTLSVPKLTDAMYKAVGTDRNVKPYEQQMLDYQKGSKTGIDYYNEAMGNLGIPDVRARVQALRRQIADVQNLTDKVDGSVTGRTSGSLVTEAGRNRLIAAEKAPLLQGLGSLANLFGAESGNLTDLTGEAGRMSDLAYGSQQDLVGMLMGRLERAQGNRGEYTRAAEEKRRHDLAVRAQKAAEDAAKLSARVQSQQSAMQQALLEAINNSRVSGGITPTQAEIKAAAQKTAKSASTSYSNQSTQAAKAYKDSVQNSWLGKAYNNPVGRAFARFGSWLDPTK